MIVATNHLPARPRRGLGTASWSSPSRDRLSALRIFSAAFCCLNACSSAISSAEFDASTHDDAESPDGNGFDRDAFVPGDATPPPSSSQVRIIVEPSDKGAALLGAIEGAQTSVHMTMYLLTSGNVISALISQHKASRDVKVVLDQNGVQSINQNAYDMLTNAGVSVHWAPSGFTFTHEKCVIVDAKEAWIMTMNATFTSPTANREYLAIDDGASDVAEAEAIFEADYASTSIAPTGLLVVAPVNARPNLVALVQGSKVSIDIEAEELSDVAFVNALNAAADRGVRVHIVLSNAPSSASQQAAIASLKKHGVKLVQVATPYIHAKSMVTDGSTAFLGSENFSGGSLGYNRELGVVFATATEVQKVLTTTTADFASGAAL